MKTRPRNAGITCLVVAGLIVGSQAHARQADSLSGAAATNATGYDKNSAYVAIDGAAIDAFNFNFLVQFPIAVGLQYPENAGLSLQLNLTYNSKFWTWNKYSEVQKALRIRRQNPYGLGFDLNLGRIVAPLPWDGGPYMYVDSSGANHRLDLHAGNEYWTRDGSHLRAVLAEDAHEWTVSFPNGSVQVLGHRIDGQPLNDLTDPTPGGCSPGSHDDCPDLFVPDGTAPWTGWDRAYVGWHVTRVYSRAATDGGTLPSYRVSYYGDDGNPSDAPFAHIIKEITDQFGRRIWTELNRTDGTVTAIHSPAPADECGSARTADYLLSYEPLVITDLPETVLGQTTYTTKVLSSISSPNVAPSSGNNCNLAGTQRYVHRFEYIGGSWGGQLKTLRYPSGRLIVLSYAAYLYTNGGPGYCIASHGGGTENPSTGVQRIDEYLNGDPLDTTTPGNHRVTTFSQTVVHHDYWIPPGGENDWCGGSPLPDQRPGYERFDQQHTMVDPAGNKTEFIYYTQKETPDEQWYGILKSQKYYGGNGPSAKLMKQVDYDYELLDSCNFAVKRNDYEMVPNRITTTWADDTDELGAALAVPTTLLEMRSEFDKFGHYQKSEFSGTAISNQYKIVHTDYASDNKAAGNVACSEPAVQAVNDNWLGDVVVQERTARLSGGVEFTVSRTDYGYDSTTGLRTRAVNRLATSAPFDPCDDSPLAAPGDDAVDYGYTPRGDLQVVHRYLTDADSAASSPVESATNYTYSYGVADSIKKDALSYYDIVRSIDPGTGLVLEERENALNSSDASAVVTNLAYDMLGRTTKVAHGTDDPRVISYENEYETYPWPSPVGPAVRLARVRESQGTSMAQTEAVDHFTFGRLEHEERLNPDSSRAYRYTSYNNSGRVSFVTEWTRQTSGAGVPGTATSYDVSDGTVLFQEPFGRPTRVASALGRVTTYRYFGLNKEVAVQGVALKANAPDDPGTVTTGYYSDALNRLRVVTAPAVASGHGYEATGAAGIYSYDVLGRLIKADLGSGAIFNAGSSDRYDAVMAVPAGMSLPQSRTFVYDTLGRLTQSTTPEKTSYNLAWNALGQVTESRDDRLAQLSFKHRTTYDGAGRPTKLERIASGGTTFQTAWSPGDSGWTASGWNYSSCLGVTSWYIGDTNCRYAQSGSIAATLTSPSITFDPGAVLTFKYRREVRDDAQAGGSRDRFRVLVQDASYSASWFEVLNLDSSQASWDKWVQSAVIDLSQLPFPANDQFKIQFEFNSVDQNTTPNLKGIGISRVELRRPAAVTLQETKYDEAFNLTGNKPRGKPTRVMDYDEATGLPMFTRELHYTDANGRLSDEVLTFDWDRDGINESVGGSYNYDSRGDLASQVMPHGLGLPARRYDYWRWHGAVTGISATDQATNAVQAIVPADMGDGFQYNDAGGMSAIRYANGLQQHIEANAESEFLPSRIWVGPESGGAPIFDTGTYLYDGARNVKQIGQDSYRYDAAMRLTWEKISTARQGIVELDQGYDVFGNMISQSAAQTGFTDGLPQGMAFASRNFISGSQNRNRITNSGFAYDANGNLRDEPAHEGLSAISYGFSLENQLTRVTAGPDSGKPLQTALYEGGDHRWFRSTWADGGKALITLRDASGQVVADFLESSAASGLQLQKEYVRVNGQLIAINSTCGLRPALSFSGAADGVVWFDRTDFGLAAVGSYTVYIRTAGGQSKTLSLPANTPSHFSIAQQQFFPGDTNWIQIETDAACGHTGYSNTVSYGYVVTSGPPTLVNCLNSISGSRYGFTGSGSSAGSSVKILAVGDDCPSGTTYNIYYVDPNAEATELVPLNSLPVATPAQVLANVPCGSGEGNYWIRTISAVTHHEVGSSPLVTIDGSNCGGLGNGLYAVPGQPSMNAQFVHSDHLGSTRMLTDEKGVTLAAFKYYPFGMEAESTGGDELRQKFTGHERDEWIGLDYMMARNCRMSLARFIQPDEYDGSARPELPQSWNRYAYVLNNPIRAVDPTGYEDLNVPQGAPDKKGSPMDAPGNAAPEKKKQPDNAVKDPDGIAPRCARGTQVPDDPTNPGHKIDENPVVKQVMDDAAQTTLNGTARAGKAEAGGTLDNEDGTLVPENKVDTVHTSTPPNHMIIHPDAATLFVYHYHSNNLDGRPTNLDASSPYPNITGSRGGTELYITIPGANCYVPMKR